MASLVRIDELHAALAEAGGVEGKAEGGDPLVSHSAVVMDVDGDAAGRLQVRPVVVALGRRHLGVDRVGDGRRFGPSRQEGRREGEA